MAQYDVFPNPSVSAVDGIPYVVVIQSDLLDSLATRMTVPLAALDFVGKVPVALCPVITVKGKQLNALTHYAAPLPVKLLRTSVGTAMIDAAAVAVQFHPRPPRRRSSNRRVCPGHDQSP